MKNSLIKTNAENFYRDESSTALVNTDSSSLKAYKKQRDNALKAADLFKQVDEIKGEMSDIKNLLKELLVDKCK